MTAFNLRNEIIGLIDIHAAGQLSELLCRFESECREQKWPLDKHLHQPVDLTAREIARAAAQLYGVDEQTAMEVARDILWQHPRRDIAVDLVAFFLDEKPTDSETVTPSDATARKLARAQGEVELTPTIIIQCGKADSDGRRFVVASFGKFEHRDTFNVDVAYSRERFRAAAIRKFGLQDEGEIHGDIEEKLTAAADAEDAREDATPLVTANVVTMADIEAKPVRWFWDHTIPAGAISVLDGDPGLGKSTIALDLAARFSRGDSPPPHNAPDKTFEVGNTLLLQAEDDAERTTKPRLVAAGARVERIHLLRTVTPFDGDGERLIQLPLDVPLIETVIIEKRIGLVVVDVLSAFMQDGMSMNDDSAMRRCLSPIALSAEKTGAAWLMLRHLNKKEGTRSMYRGGGSVSIVGAARAAFAVAPHPDDPALKVFAAIKHNLGPRPHSLTYEIEAIEETSRIRWGERTELSAADVLGQSEAKGANKTDKAKEIISEVLSVGPRGENEVRGACEEAGISTATYWRARKSMGVQSEKSAFKGEWLLSLPSMNGSGHDGF